MTTKAQLRIPLTDINGQALNALVRSAWVTRAPRRLAKARAEADTDATVGDVPRSIGRPATRALAEAGLTTLDDIATRAEAELLELHGVGPKALRLLTEALEARGMSLR